VGGIVKEHADIRDGIDVPLAEPLEEGGIEQNRDAMSATAYGEVADDTLFDKLLDLAVDRILPHLERNAELDAGPVHHIDDAVAIGKRRGHRFLQEDVLAGLGSQLHEFGVAIGLAPDDYGVYVRIGNDVPSRLAVLHSEVSSSLLPSLDDIIPDSHQLDIIEFLNGATVGVDVTVGVGERGYSDRRHLGYPLCASAPLREFGRGAGEQGGEVKNPK
jgi:hypothetical protein